MENTEIMNNEAMETMSDMAQTNLMTNCSSVLTKVGVGVAAVAAGYGIYRVGKKLWTKYKAKNEVDCEAQGYVDDEE